MPPVVVKRKAVEEKPAKVPPVSASGPELLEQADAICERIDQFFQDLAEQDHEKHEGVPTAVLKAILMRNSKCACEALRVHLKAKK